MNKEKRRLRRGLKAKAIHRRCSTRPRLVVFRSTSHIYAQIIVRDAKDDKSSDRVIVSASTVDKELKSALTGNKVEQAQQVGKLLAERAIASNVSEIAFDRAGYRYHGRVKALADGARAAGLIF